MVSIFSELLKLQALFCPFASPKALEYAKILYYAFEELP